MYASAVKMIDLLSLSLVSDLT